MRWNSGRTWLAVAAALTLLAPVQAFADTGHSIGKVDPAIYRATGNALDLPVTSLIGRDFVFLEKPKPMQRFGYTSFELAGGSPGAAEDLTTADGSLRYDRFVGKTVRIVDVMPHPRRGGEFSVVLEDPRTGLRLLTGTSARLIRDLALLDDLTQARQHWLGKTLYARTQTVSTYDAEQDIYGTLAVKASEPLKVVDVIPGLDAVRPLWVVVERSNGERGFVATSYSWTNVYTDWWSRERPWEDKLAETNPKEFFYANNEQGEQRWYQKMSERAHERRPR